MLRTQRSISIRKHILGKLKLNQIESNPICPVNKAYRINTKKPSKCIPTIEQEIFSTTSIKMIKPYNTEKLINFQCEDYSICSVLRSHSYQKLQTKLIQMMQQFGREKKQLTKDIKNIDKEIEQQTIKAGELCSRLMKLDESYERLENEYYQVRRKNYELRAQANERRQGDRIWNINLNGEPFDNSRVIDLDQMSYEQILEMQERLGKHNVGLGKEGIAKLTVAKLRDIEKEKEDSSRRKGEDKKETMNCSICCDVIEEEENVIKLQCEHIHHAGCIKEWLKIKRFCPLCKGEVKVE